MFHFHPLLAPIVERREQLKLLKWRFKLPLKTWEQSLHQILGIISASKEPQRIINGKNVFSAPIPESPLAKSYKLSTKINKSDFTEQKSTDKQIDHFVIKWPTLTMWKSLIWPKRKKTYLDFCGQHTALNLDLFKLPSKVGSPWHISVSKYYQFQEETENCNIDKDSVVTQVVWWPSL